MKMVSQRAYGWMALVISCVAAAGCSAAEPLVDLDASALTPGLIEAWPNRGSAGGQFATSEGKPRPQVVDVAGRRAVRLNGPFLASSFATPASLSGNRPFTLLVTARAEKLAGKQVVVSWAARPWDAAEFAYGTGAEGAYCSYGSGNFGMGKLTPAAQAWHDLAYVFAEDRFAVYADGELVVDRKITLKTKAGDAIRIGTAWDHLKKEPCFPFPGEIAAVKIFDRGLSVREVRNQAGRFEPFGPAPADGAVLELRQVALAWQAGQDKVEGFRVYLGEDKAAVESATSNSPLCRTSQPVSQPALDRAELTLGKTYYWRVEQVQAGSAPPRKGPIWSFSLSAGPARQPIPRDRVAGASLETRELRWTPGPYAVTQDVYFGEDEQAVARTDRPLAKALPADVKACPLPARLEPGKRYYWRVDQNNGTLPPARGPVWAFRTADDLVKDDVTFFVGSDCHYGREEINELTSRTLDRMNWLPGETWPAACGGLVVRTPRGVAFCGDLLDNGGDKATAPASLERMWKDFGLTGEGRLAFPVYEGFGNHDGGPGSFVRQALAERNKRRPNLAGVSENGLHYSWDWGHVHLVQVNLFPGSGPQDVASVSAKPHDPEKALEFLIADLAKHVGASGRPVVIFQHFGLPPDGMSHWWQMEAKDRFREAVKPYNVAAVIHGHSHAATLYRWKGLRIIADGSTIRPETDGGDFLVVRITKDEMFAAIRQSDRWGEALREKLGAAASAAAPSPSADPAPASAPAAPPAPATQPARKRNVTFVSTSDSHYKAFESENWNMYNAETIEEINRIPGQPWPKPLGGDPIDAPRGVLALGDCIDDGDKVVQGKDYTAAQLKFFLADFGVMPPDGKLKFPVFEAWGNHDGPPAGSPMKSSVSFQAELKKRNTLRKEKGLIQNLSESGLHYSWDWDDVHLVNLGIYPADKQNPKVRYSPKWHDPQGALAFLKQDLEKNVGSSGRPVVLMSHMGFDTDWWILEDWTAAYEVAKGYNVVLYLYGHTGTGLKDWAPPGQTRKWTCINDGNTPAGFFVIQIEGGRLRAAYRCKENVKTTRNADRTHTREWGGQWGWRFTLDRKFEQN